MTGESTLLASIALTATSLSQSEDTTVEIGETATWVTTITLPQGTSSSMVYTDTMPDTSGSLSWVSCTLTAVGADLTLGTASLNDACSISDQVATMTFGSVTNGIDGVSDSEDQLQVTMVAVVDNDATQNADGTSITHRCVRVCVVCDVVCSVLCVVCCGVMCSV